MVFKKNITKRNEVQNISCQISQTSFILHYYILTLANRVQPTKKSGPVDADDCKYLCKALFALLLLTKSCMA